MIQIVNDLLNGVRELAENIEADGRKLIILPEWVYFHRNNLRLLHYEPFLFKDDPL